MIDLALDMVVNAEIIVAIYRYTQYDTYLRWISNECQSSCEDLYRRFPRDRHPTRALRHLIESGSVSPRPRTNRNVKYIIRASLQEMLELAFLNPQRKVEISEACGYTFQHVWYFLYVHGMTLPTTTYHFFDTGAKHWWWVTMLNDLIIKLLCSTS